MKDAFGYNFWHNEYLEWIKMAGEAQRKGFWHLANCFIKLGNQSLNKAEECK